MYWYTTTSILLWINSVIFSGILGETQDTILGLDPYKSDTKGYCSFFNNRAPKPQPSLKNCTWFIDYSCCYQEEIAVQFGRVKALPGASLACQKYTNYLMCYMCAPFQNIFYERERLTVCEEFCNEWYGACKSAILKGSVVGSLYKNGRDFCTSRSYEVATMSSKKCFFFDTKFDKTSNGYSIKSNIFEIFCVLTLLYTMLR